MQILSVSKSVRVLMAQARQSLADNNGRDACATAGDSEKQAAVPLLHCNCLPCALLLRPNLIIAAPTAISSLAALPLEWFLVPAEVSDGVACLN